MPALTEELIKSKTKAETLEDVTKLNICGHELTDVSILRQLPRVELLSLSMNAITTLADFSQCTNLRELYLRKNQVPDTAELRHIEQLPNLRQLWLSDNPCAAEAGYRAAVVRRMPGLVKLDGTDVTEEDRRAASREVSPRRAAGEAGPASGQGTPSGATGGGVGGGLKRASVVSSVDGAGKAQSGSNNVLYAVMALLRDLDEDALKVVKAECEHRLTLKS
ncbi:unnamed protein product [Pedinophyceae sp. YPF-701]|nr:unnamed protein product [Pedinophyceae sp. YPF-701]